jgi:hypothetical protein
MGFELYLQLFAETEELGLPRAEIRGFFPVDKTTSEADYWRLRYDDRNKCDIGVTPLPGDSTRLAGLYVDRPCRDIRLWNSLFALLKMGSVVLFFPGGPLILAEGIAASRLPEGMAESLGAPVYVDSGESIRRIVEE